jgi:hypothetical protein
MSASVSFADVKAMMDVCANGWTFRTSTHSRVIHYNSLVYRAFPKHDPVELGHVRKMARYFGILACAKQQIQGL